ncbi:hypothetical protein [Streptomyces sp. NPDC059455]|uniref:hypothetical protein n=1 Tax=Streptomyces sp. NPDC059455 TaxID=3346837 RepID=UPI0036A44F54
MVDGTAVVIGSWCTARLRRAGHLPSYALAYIAQGVFWALTFAAGNVTLGLVLSLWWITTARRANLAYLTAAHGTPPRPVAAPPHAE